MTTDQIIAATCQDTERLVQKSVLSYQKSGSQLCGIMKDQILEIIQRKKV